MFRFLNKTELNTIGEDVVILEYQLDKDCNLKEARAYAKGQHKIENDEDIQLLQGGVLRCITRKKTKIIICPSKPSAEPKKGEDRWEEEISVVKRKKR